MCFGFFCTVGLFHEETEERRGWEQWQLSTQCTLTVDSFLYNGEKFTTITSYLRHDHWFCSRNTYSSTDTMSGVWTLPFVLILRNHLRNGFKCGKWSRMCHNHKGSWKPNPIAKMYRKCTELWMFQQVCPLLIMVKLRSTNTG